jgi:hypothetical protein
MTIIPRSTAFCIQPASCAISALALRVLTRQSFGDDIHSTLKSPFRSLLVLVVPAVPMASSCVIRVHSYPCRTNFISASRTSSTTRTFFPARPCLLGSDMSTSPSLEQESAGSSLSCISYFLVCFLPRLLIALSFGLTEDFVSGLATSTFSLRFEFPRDISSGVGGSGVVWSVTKVISSSWLPFASSS